MFKILHARLQQYMNRELPDVPAGFRKDKRTRDQIANIRSSIKNKRVPGKKVYFYFADLFLFWRKEELQNKKKGLPAKLLAYSEL